MNGLETIQLTKCQNYSIEYRPTETLDNPGWTALLLHDIYFVEFITASDI